LDVAFRHGENELSIQPSMKNQHTNMSAKNAA
jgi:hypothetical protein